MMHSSIGTGSLAYAVGSKVMDMRTMSKDDGRRDAEVNSRRASNISTNKLETYCDSDNNCTDVSNACPRQSSSDSEDLSSVRQSIDEAYNSCYVSSSCPYNCSSPKLGIGTHGSPYVTESFCDFPPLPVTDLFEKSGKDKKGRRSQSHDDSLSTRRKLSFEDDHLYNFQINNNVDLVMESNNSSSNDIPRASRSEIEIVHADAHEPASHLRNSVYRAEIVNGLRIADAPEVTGINIGASKGGGVGEEKVSEWLWTLHRIGNN